HDHDRRRHRRRRRRPDAGAPPPAQHPAGAAAGRIGGRMTASRRVTKWGLGVVLAAVAVGAVAAAPPGEAAPASPRPTTCDLGGGAHLFRSRYTLPQRRPADVDFDDYGFRFNPRAPEDWLYACSGEAQIPPRDSRVEDRFVVLYRQQAGGEWVLERDNL